MQFLELNQTGIASIQASNVVDSFPSIVVGTEPFSWDNFSECIWGFWGAPEKGLFNDFE